MQRNQTYTKGHKSKFVFSPLQTQKLFLSKAEWDYLTSNRQFDNDYSYTIKSRLFKKLHRFTSQELPLLVEKGYLTEFCKLTDNCKVQQEEGDSLVRIPPQTSVDRLESSNCFEVTDKKTSGPAEIRTPDPRHVKASLNV